MVDGHVDVEHAFFVAVAGVITLGQKLFIHPDGGGPFFRTLGGVAPHEESPLIVKVVAGGLIGLWFDVLVLHVALFERFHGVIKHVQFDFAVAAMIPEPAKAGPEELEGTGVVGVGGLDENGLCFGPFASLHGIKGFFVHIGQGLSLHRSAETAKGEQDDTEGSADRLNGVHGSCGGVRIFGKKKG